MQRLEKIWESPALQPLGGSFVLTSPPLVWENYLILGASFGDVVLEGPPATKGTVTALDKKNGKIMWQINTVGDWVKGKNASTNGGATVWSGGAIDADKGIVYLPCGNPDLISTRPADPGRICMQTMLLLLILAPGRSSGRRLS